MGSLWILKTRKPWTDRAGCAEPANAANAQGPDGWAGTRIGETPAGFVRDFGAVRQKSRERVSIEDQLRERWLTAIKEFGADAALRDASEAFAPAFGCEVSEASLWLCAPGERCHYRLAQLIGHRRARPWRAHTHLHLPAWAGARRPLTHVAICESCRRWHSRRGRPANSWLWCSARRIGTATGFRPTLGWPSVRADCGRAGSRSVAGRRSRSDDQSVHRRPYGNLSTVGNTQS